MYILYTKQYTVYIVYIDQYYTHFEKKVKANGNKVFLSDIKHIVAIY